MAFRGLARRFVCNSRGQLVIPALFVLPSLMLFVYLIFETAKLSREKIRHQFAVDAAVFVEMTAYADLLNRTAYINGAFPARVFKESFESIPPIGNMSDVPGDAKSLLDMLWENGVYPRPPPYLADSTGDGLTEQRGNWAIRYGAKGTRDTHPQEIDLDSEEDMGVLTVIRFKQADGYYFNYEDSLDVWKIVSQIYSLLGSVEGSQVKVFDRLTKGHQFYKKSWILNTGLGAETAGEAIESWNDQDDVKVYCHYVWGGGTYGKFMTGDLYSPYGVKGFGKEGGEQSDDKISYKMDPLDSGRGFHCGGGLFQLATVTPSALDYFSRSGVRISQKWTPPVNYFDVDVDRLVRGAVVHSTVRVTGGSIWPDPTPRFQTRLYP